MLAEPCLGKTELFSPLDKLEIAAQADGRALDHVMIRRKEQPVFEIYRHLLPFIAN